MHDYANLCIIRHDTTLFSSLRFMITKAHVKFQPNGISGSQEKVEQTNR